MDVRDVSITQALHEGGIGPIPIGVIGSPETSHADHGFMTIQHIGIIFTFKRNLLFLEFL